MSQMMIQAGVTMNQLQQKLDLIGNNMANAQTTGYKSRQADFSSLLFQHMNNLSDPANLNGRLTPDGIRIGSGARLGSINPNLNQGNFQETDRELDTALINPNTFYHIQVTENDIVENQLTRDGAFYLNPMNNSPAVMLTTGAGHPVLGTNNEPIEIVDDFDAIDIQPNGSILVKRGDTEAVEGQINAMTAIRPRVLEAAGKNAFRLPNVAELGLNEDEIIQQVAPNTDILKSHTLEQSNVDLTEQMTELLQVQRAYQFNARTISMGDEMMGLINQLR